jgi:hypothetical protein
MKNYDFLTGLFLAIVSGGTCIMAYRLGLGGFHNPGPGFFSLGIAVLLGLMSLFLCLKGFFQTTKKSKEKKSPEKLIHGKAMAVLGSLLGYGIFFNFLGLAISTFLLMMFLVGVVGQRKWRLALAVSFLAVAFAYLFMVLLEVPFPRGILGI